MLLVWAVSIFTSKILHEILYELPVLEVPSDRCWHMPTLEMWTAVL